MKQCPNCQVPLLLTYVPYGAEQCQEIWRCVRCTYQENGALCEGAVHVEPEFTITVTLQRQNLTPQTIKALRQMDPRLTEEPLIHVFTQLKTRAYWTIPSLSYQDVQRCQEICDQWNLIYHIR